MWARATSLLSLTLLQEAVFAGGSVFFQIVFICFFVFRCFSSFVSVFLGLLLVFLCFSLFFFVPAILRLRELRGTGLGGPGTYFSPIAGRRSGRYLRSKRGIRLQAQLRLAHVPTRSLAFLARFAPVPTRIFVGPYSPLAGAILEGPPAHNPYCWRTDLTDSGVGSLGDDAASRSDPTFTRASPGLRQ